MARYNPVLVTHDIVSLIVFLVDLHDRHCSDSTSDTLALLSTSVLFFALFVCVINRIDGLTQL